MDPLALTATGVLVLVGVGIGAFFRFGPGKVLGAVSDALLGTPDVLDRRGEIITEGEPGLVRRTTSLEETSETLTDAVAKLTVLVAEQADLRGDVEALKAATANHDALLSVLNPTVAALVAASAERAATADAAAAMLRLATDKDALLGEVDDDE